MSSGARSSSCTTATSGPSPPGEDRAPRREHAGLSAPLLRVRAVSLRERDVRLRLPFRFGAVTLTEATEAYARVRVTLEDGRSAWGQAAEMLAPKWFDKDPALSNADNAEQLRSALRLAKALYLEGRIAHTAF